MPRSSAPKQPQRDQTTSPSDAAIERPDPLLRVDDLGVVFDTPNGSIRPVDGVSLTIAAGEAVGIVGESGSGKSVLMRTVMGLLPPTASVEPGSRIEFAGQDLLALPPWVSEHFWGTEVAMVFQDPMTSLNPVKQIGVQLTESLRFHLGLSRRAARERGIELLEQVQISEPRRRMRQYPHELSGGMRQRVTIAIALACEPRLLIADEPTTALDVTVQRQILDLLRTLQLERGMALVLITHDLGVVVGHTDRVAVMYAGQLVEQAPSDAIFESPHHPYAAALIRSIPRLETPIDTRLETIGGRPPSLVEPAPGCRFAPRCPEARPQCHAEGIRMLPAPDPEREYRCLFPLGLPDHEAPSGDRVDVTAGVAGRHAERMEHR